jgi:hypothetical protein
MKHSASADVRIFAELPYELIVRDLDDDYAGLVSGLDQMLTLTRLVVRRLDDAAELGLNPLNSRG